MSWWLAKALRYLLFCQTSVNLTGCNSDLIRLLICCCSSTGHAIANHLIKLRSFTTPYLQEEDRLKKNRFMWITTHTAEEAMKRASNRCTNLVNWWNPMLNLFTKPRRLCFCDWNRTGCASDIRLAKMRHATRLLRAFTAGFGCGFFTNFPVVKVFFWPEFGSFTCFFSNISCNHEEIQQCAVRCEYPTPIPNDVHTDGICIQHKPLCLKRWLRCCHQHEFQFSSVASISSWSNFIYKPKSGITRIRAPSMATVSCLLSKVNSLNGR